MTKKVLITKFCCLALPVLFLTIVACKKEAPEPSLGELKDLTKPTFLTYPTDIATDIPLSFTFKWDASSWTDGKNHGTFSYEILYGKTINSLETKASLADGVTEYSVSGLELKTKYYWKVKTFHDGYLFIESEVISFTTTIGLPPTVPLLISPVNNATNISVKPTLKWNFSTDPEGKQLKYDVYLDKSTNPQTKILENQTSTALEVPLGVDGESKYFWKVVAKDPQGNETASEIRSFTTKDKGWIPDANFRAYLKAKFPNAFQGDTLIYKHPDITGFNGKFFFTYKGISSLKGIEYFTALKKLDCNGNSITSIDLSKNIALTMLDMSSNYLTSLDVSNNNLLDTLCCYDNKLTTLDFGNNSLLKSLLCSFNNLSSLILNANSALTSLDCRDNKLTTLDLSNCPSLYLLDCSDNLLTSMNLTNVTLLHNLYCEGNKLSALDLSNKIVLEDFSCSRNRLSVIDVANCAKLHFFYCDDNLLTTIDLSNNLMLNYFTCSNNKLTTLDISSQTSLSFLNIDAGSTYNPLTLLRVNDTLKNHQEVKDAKTNEPSVIIEVYSSGFKTCSNYDPNANSGSGSCVTP